MIQIRYVFSFLALLILFPSYSQEGTEETDRFIASVDTEYYDQPLTAIQKLEEYLTKYKAKEEQNFIDLDNLYYGLAYYSLSANDLEKTKYYSRRGLKNLTEGNIDGKAAYYNLLGNVAQTENKLDSSALYFIKCIEELRIENDLGKIPFVMNNIGLTYAIQGDYVKALEYHKEAYSLIVPNESEDGSLNSAIAGDMSKAYVELDSLEKADEFATIAITLDHINMPRGGLVDGLYTKSRIAEINQQNDSAYIYALRAYDVASTREDKKLIAKTSANLGRLLLVDNPAQAIKYASKACKLFKEINDKEFIKTLKILSDAYVNVKDYENAALYQKEYIGYQDSLLRADYTKNTVEILEKYQASQKELKIEQQNLEISKKENQKNIFILLTCSLAIIAILLLFVFRQYRKTQQEKFVNLEKEQENVALKSLIIGEEKERSRIAKELHDGIGSLLAASKMYASTLSDINTGTSKSLVELIDNAAKETRRISHNLLPESLVIKGLDVSLQDFIMAINESQLIKADYQSFNLSSNLPQSTQLMIYRIIQELINNIIKHSGATEAFVQLNQHGNKLIITVEDNGKGFSYDQLNNGIGLQNIKSRLSLLNGKIEVASQDKLGTSVHVEFELEKNESLV
jgi:signal transduction histidine kinase